MTQRDHDNLGSDRDAALRSELPSDLRRLASMLDDEGAFARAALSEQALDRITAASDLHLPIPATPAVPHRGHSVVARIGPSSSRGHGYGLLRLAAVVAFAAALVTAFVAWRLATGPGASGRSAPSGTGTLAEAGGAAPTVLPSPEFAPSPDDYDRVVLALGDAGVGVDSTSDARTAAVAAITMSERALGWDSPGVMTVALLDESDADPAYGSDGFASIDFGGLAGEMTAIMRETTGFSSSVRP